ncbi:uncharacterized protein BYT42DRAFT_616365 [Radiomyces spectabilis]|uniref:uncharacterized protein n=1 Tax=Radiomyces spectabilis TaxID=64574 RepID=UPI00222104BA|nr:uncharacterized protein BYT42DRAFT_616365 [Radiomyces spectabilis]KAI8373195.1 hypothetical protein BYT42DRAFT_616365 [Radiomyces spectabilis]
MSPPPDPQHMLAKSVITKALTSFPSRDYDLLVCFSSPVFANFLLFVVPVLLLWCSFGGRRLFPGGRWQVSKSVCVNPSTNANSFNH